MPFTCPKCGTDFYERLKYCPECGFDFTAGQKRCPRCRSQVYREAEICPVCGLDFEKWAFLVPRLVLSGILLLALIIVLVFPWVWKSRPWLHDKGVITEGQLRSEVEGEMRVPMFIHWKTGEKYIAKSAEASGLGYSTDYMNNLIPLPPAVVFHYDIPIGERVWIIRRLRSGATAEWVKIGRWGRDHDKYGWVHNTNIRAEE